MRNGDKTSPDHSQDGSTVKLCGRIDGLWSGSAFDTSSASKPAPGTDIPPTSIMLRMPMINSIIQIWNRSTMSAHVSWKRLSFSMRLNTVLLTSTNWLDIRSVKRAFEYELTATLSVMTW